MENYEVLLLELVLQLNASSMIKKLPQEPVLANLWTFSNASQFIAVRTLYTGYASEGLYTLSEHINLQKGQFLGPNG